MSNRREFLAVIVVTVLLGTLLAGAAAAATAPSLRVELSSRDARLVATAACGGGEAGADRLDARQHQRGSRAIHVIVECEPHATDQSVPVARHTTCDNTRGTWQCDRGQQALLITLPDQTILPVLPQQVATAAAIEAIREAAKLTIRPFYRPAVKVMKGKCTVGETRTSASSSMTSFEIRCGETLIVLTKDCWKEQCRFFIPFAQNY